MKKTYRVSGYEKTFFSVEVEAESWEDAVYEAYDVHPSERIYYGDSAYDDAVMDCVDRMENGVLAENVASLSDGTWFDDDGHILKEDYEL